MNLTKLQDKHLRKPVLLLAMISLMLNCYAQDRFSPAGNEKDSVKVGILENIDVYGSKNKSIALKSKYIGATYIPISTIIKTPVILGETDLVKTLQLEPGVSSGVEGFAGLYVHGGDNDENQFSINGVPVYQISHLAGLFSAFNTNVIKNVDFFKTTFPAQYDGRLSSYVDIHTSDGDAKKFHGSVNLGLISGSLNLEGPIVKDKTSFSLAVRRSWLDIFLKPALKYYNNSPEAVTSNINYNFDYTFMDANAKIVHRFSPFNKIYLEAYYGQDDVMLHRENFEAVNQYSSILLGTDKSIEYAFDWGNRILSAGWDKIWNPRFQSSFNASVLQYASKMNQESDSKKRFDINAIPSVPTQQPTITPVDIENSGYRSSNKIQDITLRADFNWQLSTQMNLKFGTYSILREFSPFWTENWKYVERKNNNENIKYLKSYQDSTSLQKGIESHIYCDYELNITDKLLVNAGLNASGFYLDNHNTRALSPRIAFNYRHRENISFKGGYSRTAQYVHQLCQTNLSLPTDQWLPINNDQKPMTADKIAAGVYYSPQKDIILSAEAYYKWMHNLIDYRDNLHLYPSAQQSQLALVTGSGTAKGFDFKAMREYGKLTGQIGYSLLWADRLFPERMAASDSRHSLTTDIKLTSS